jgi:hypothetical protein
VLTSDCPSGVDCIGVVNLAIVIANSDIGICLTIYVVAKNNLIRSTSSGRIGKISYTYVETTCCYCIARFMPKQVFLKPVVCDPNESLPTAVLKYPVVFAPNAPYPTAVLL